MYDISGSIVGDKKSVKNCRTMENNEKTDRNLLTCEQKKKACSGFHRLKESIYSLKLA